jgi:hypothetical protein
MAATGEGAGRVIAGRYRLIHSLGAGGMGQVWLAYDLELACEVALKEIAQPVGADEEDIAARIARARSEARNAARLRDHPHVATVHDVVEEDGLPWIVMEFVPHATDLDKVVREQGPLPPAEVARIGAAVADALVEGHRLGILHRDVKPANILLTRPEPRAARYKESAGKVMLADYGIALQPESGQPRLTGTSGIVGTPGFLAPERARGAPPSPASDLFSLGSTLYFAVEGRGPFDRDLESATLTALLFEEPPPAERADELRPVLLGLLEKDPVQRMDGEEAARRLEEIGATHRRGTPEKVPTVAVGADEGKAERALGARGGDGGGGAFSEGRDGESWWRRRKRGPVILVGSVLAVLLVAGAALWAGASLLDGDETARQAPAPTTTSATETGPVGPYGGRVGLERPLKPGDCVSASWNSDKFQDQPRLGVVDCGKASPDGQVVDVIEQTSLENARTDGQAFCEGAIRDVVGKMADARAYALPPSQAGWDRGLHHMACLVFNKSAALMGPVGSFRTYGDEFRMSNSMIGDCFDTEDRGDFFVWVLQSCKRAHEQQVVGFVEAPKGISFEELTGRAYGLCSNEFGVKYKNEEHDLWAWYDDQLWNSGYRYLMCGVIAAEEGEKLPPGSL